MSAERLAERWVGLYTRGLPSAIREQRRDEIASDLWEQRLDGGDGVRTDLAIASRALRGMVADVSWRRRQRRRRRHDDASSLVRPVLRALGWTVAAASYLFFIGLHGFGATALVGLDLYGEDWAPGDVEFYARISATLLVLLVGGMALVRRIPVVGSMLVVLALAAQALVFWWAAPILVPLGAAIAIATIVIATRCENARQLRASSAAS